MNKNSKIYIAGHNGLAGSAIYRKLNNEGYSNLIVRNSTELDLRNPLKVKEFFNEEKPEYVFFAAGKIGGILANKNNPVDFLYDNITMFFNTIKSAYQFNVKKLLYLGSSCIYPSNSIQPIKEEFLLSGSLEETNKAFSLAKISCIELCTSYNKQFNTNYLTLIPCNLFGINDNYDLNNSHLVAALIRKIYEAKIKNTNKIILWGSGNPKREIMLSDNLASSCIEIMKLEKIEDKILNVGSQSDFSIKEIAFMISEIADFNGEIIFDTNMPDGVFQKKLDLSKSNKYNINPHYNIKEDLRIAYQDFVKNYKFYTSL
jgi:GDP-L-fucose synthase